LDVLVFVSRAVGHLIETNLECYFLAGIVVEIKTKGVKTLFPKSVGPPAPASGSMVRAIATVPRCSAKKIKVAKIDSRILSSGGVSKSWDISGTP
jgi:hypothetical protein